jgi:hypothetical protein
MNQRSHVARSDTVLLPHDPQAVEIGRLYGRGWRSASDAVLYWAEAGRELIAKKKALGHGSWLGWLEQNADVLGFETSKAQRLMKLAKVLPNTASTPVLDDDAALPLLRQLWGNDNTRGNQEAGDDDLAVARLTGAMGRVAKFCRTNDADHLADVIRPNEIAELKGHAREIVAWLGRFTAHRRA